MHVVESHCARSAAAFIGKASTSMIDENPSHRLRGDAEKLRPVFPRSTRLIYQAEVNLVYESRRLERVSHSLPAHCPCGSAMQFIVDERQKLIGGGVVPVFPCSQESGHVGTRKLRKWRQGLSFERWHDTTAW